MGRILSYTFLNFNFLIISNELVSIDLSSISLINEWLKGEETNLKNEFYELDGSKIKC